MANSAGTTVEPRVLRDPLRISRSPVPDPRRGLLNRGAVAWVTYAAIAFASGFRQVEPLQVAVGDLYVPVQFLVLLFLAVLGMVRLGAARGKTGRFPASLLISGPIFFLYAVVVDNFRSWDSHDALLVDCLHVLLPVIAAVGILGSMSERQKERFFDGLLAVMLVICLVYMMVALLALNLDFGIWVARRYARAQGFTVLQLGGPLGNASSLGIVLLPCVALCWQKLRETHKARRWYGLALLVFVLSDLWTLSRVHILALFLLVIFAMSMKRWLVVACGMVVLVLNLYEGGIIASIVPERWILFGFSDPGRVMAMDTSVRAWTSSREAFLIGVGSDRLNILTRAVTEGARGIFFADWYTKFGHLPGGPHGILWWSLGSYGLLGAALRCSFVVPFLLSVLRAFILQWKCRQALLLPAAVAVSSFGLFTDDAHIIHPYLMMIWYMFLLRAMGNLRTLAEKRER